MQVFSDKVVEETNWEMTLDAEDIWTKMKLASLKQLKRFQDNQEQFCSKAGYNAME